MIVIQNWDKPGIIGNLGTLLGENNINIATMTFGREKAGGKAISVLNVDSQVWPEMLDKIKKIENILEVKVIRL
jgi:D-3-phosphoglycerate dehydrogenase